MNPRRSIALTIALLAMMLPLSAVTAAGVNLSVASQPPNPAPAGIGFPVTVHVQDDGAVPLQGVLVTLDIAPDHNPGGATLSCTNGTSRTSGASGNAAFSGCRINAAGVGYQLRAVAAGASTVASATFTVLAGPPAALAFLAYPTAKTSPHLAPEPVVAVVDAGGNIVSGDNRTITLAVDRHGNTFSCAGGTSRTAVNGVATFSGCVQSTLDDKYRLTASDGPGGLSNVQSPQFEVVAGLASRLLLCWGPDAVCRTIPPTGLIAATAFSLQPFVRVVDVAGQVVTTDSTTRVALAVLAGTPTSGGPGVLTCTGGQTKTVVKGVANFAGCAISKAGVGYRLNATSSPAFTSAASDPFTLAAFGSPTKLVFVVQPPTQVVAGAPFGTDVQVATTDVAGNVVTQGIVATIALAIGKGPGAAILTCTNGTVAGTTAGIATFTGCRVSHVAKGYTLTAAAASTTPTTTLTAATSRAFDATASAAVIALATSPASGVIGWGETVVLMLHFSPNGGGRPVQLQVSRDRLSWSTIAALTTNGNGDASFGYRPSDNRYYRVTFGGAADLAAAQSAIARVVVRQLNLLRPTHSGRTQAVAAGTELTFTSTVRPNRPELPQAHVNFVVYRLIGSTWTLVLNPTFAVGGQGRASLRVTFSTPGRYYVRSQAVPTIVNANSGWSALERYDVV